MKWNFKGHSFEMVDAEICRDSVAVWWESDAITSLPRSLVCGRSS